MLRELIRLALVRHAAASDPDELKFAPRKVVDRSEGGEMTKTRHDDEGTWVPVRDAERQTVVRHGERGLRASEERLHSLLEAAGVGHWDYDYS
jgi:hypothetical protein